MLRTRLVTTTRRYSNFSFLSNEQLHIFEQEKLTPEQNKAAIPKKPSFDSIPKRHYEIINPEDVCDLVTQLTSDDILVGVLSKEKYLYGDKKHSVYSKKGEKVGVQLPFANIAISWRKLFNQQIVKLDNLEMSDRQIFPAVSKVMAQQLEGISTSDIPRVFHLTRAKENSDKKLKGELTPHELLNCITIEKLTLFLLERKVNVGYLISYLGENLQYCTSKEITTILSKLIDVVQPQELLVDLVVKCIETQFESVKQLSSVKLDQLAYLLAQTNHPTQALKILKQLVENNKKCPTDKTLNEMLNQFKNQTQPQLQLHFLKSVFFTTKLTNLKFEILLKSISDIHDLNKLLTLAKEYPDILEQNQLKLLSLLLKFTEDCSVSDRRLYLTQFIRNLQQKFKVNSEFSELAKQEYIKLNDHVNTKSL
ncbi:hypothetical protein JA1_000010 [Spathaspora sp. JA1]|nr:hypothetical protein JA1_000010 [Spathaspora sp. JA1]